jgi:hypothetical protein
MKRGAAVGHAGDTETPDNGLKQESNKNQSRIKHGKREKCTRATIF